MAVAVRIEPDLGVPDDEVAAWAADAVEVLEGFLKRHPDPSTRSVVLVSHNDAVLEVPGDAVEMLFDVLAHMALPALGRAA